jgi:transcriptional regulator with XRE-family HTH domain
MDAAQCRAARALMGWSANELAHRSGVSLATVRRFETGLSAPMPANLKAMREAFERAGVEFIEGGVRRR